MFSAGLILLIYTGARYRSNFKHIQQDWLILTGIAIFTTFMPAILKAYALSHLQASHAALLGSIDPFVTALYAYLLWGEKLSITKFIGIIIGCLGVITAINLSSTGLFGCLPPLIPQLAALAAVTLSRFGWTMVQMQLRKNRYPPSQLNSIVMVESGILALTSSFWIDPIKTITIPSMPYFILLMAYTVLIGNVIAYTLYGQILKQHNATFVSLAGFSIPIFTGLLSWIFSGTPLTFHFALSASIIFFGLLIFYYDEIKTQQLA